MHPNLATTRYASSNREKSRRFRTRCKGDIHQFPSPDGFGTDAWYEIKVNLNSESITDLKDQLTRQAKVASSYGKQVRIVTSVSISSIGSNKLDLCQQLGIKVMALN